MNIATIDPGLRVWAVAYKMNWHGENDKLITQSFKAKTEKAIYYELFHGGMPIAAPLLDVVGIEDTWQAPQNEETGWTVKGGQLVRASKTKGAPPKTVALLNRIVGICEAWAYSRGAEVVLIPCYPAGKGWKATYKLNGRTDKEVIAKAKEVTGIDCDTVHAACAVLMHGWLERRLEKRSIHDVL